ncbi:hypothetical protein G3576_13230 [Roseomonas stagni]|uniref:Uncharacterized protein n=1 Tax=Falsiroseomonas algicola TaxID=2716930 RepID=A0A6M1LKW2_9PROT|nr:hypothetical protein [Falsiroseomonas algicola]NGM20980.1 hypothetical protein [Falsiroseomonas algicola]
MASDSGDPASGLLTDKLLDHVEKAFGDNYRKEIDQEENIWRSLPFFAASLALQLAAIVGLASNLPALTAALWWAVATLLGCVALSSLATIGFLAASIAPARFRYLAPEPDLRTYALSLAAAEAAQRAATGQTEAGPPPPDGLTVLKNEMARQYAVATHNNRLINQRRATRRAWAGLCMLASVLATLILVGVTVHAHISVADNDHAGAQSHGIHPEPRRRDDGRTVRPEEGEHGGVATQQPRLPSPGATSGDARREEGLVERHDREPSPGSGSREGGP